MTEEEARPENTQRGASQSDEKPESQKSLTDKISSLFAGTLSFKQTKEQKTMANNEETRPEGTQSPLQPNRLLEQTSPLVIDTQAKAQEELTRIKTALIGPKPEWCLPTINPKAQASVPKINDSILCRLKQSCEDPKL